MTKLCFCVCVCCCYSNFSSIRFGFVFYVNFWLFRFNFLLFFACKRIDINRIVNFTRFLRTWNFGFEGIKLRFSVDQTIILAIEGLNGLCLFVRRQNLPWFYLNLDIFKIKVINIITWWQWSSFLALRTVNYAFLWTLNWLYCWFRFISFVIDPESQDAFSSALSRATFLLVIRKTYRKAPWSQQWDQFKLRKVNYTLLLRGKRPLNFSSSHKTACRT